MNVAKAGPTRPASLDCRFCLRPARIDTNPLPGRAAVSVPQGQRNLMITMQDACNPHAARQTFQIENEMAAVPFVAVPEFQRRAAGRAPIRGNGFGCARRSGPRSARCPWRRAVCPACAACRVSLQPRLRPNLSTHCADRYRQTRQQLELHRRGYRTMAAATSSPSSAPDAPKVRPSSCAIGKEVRPAP